MSSASLLVSDRCVQRHSVSRLIISSYRDTVHDCLFVKDSPYLMCMSPIPFDSEAKSSSSLCSNGERAPTNGELCSGVWGDARGAVAERTTVDERERGAVGRPAAIVARLLLLVVRREGGGGGAAFFWSEPARLRPLWGVAEAEVGVGC